MKAGYALPSALALVSFAGALSASENTSREAPPLTLVDCGSLSQAALGEHLSLELATLGLSDTSARLTLRCEPGRIVVLLAGRGDQSPVSAVIELRDTAPSARERLLALAASELVAQAERAHPPEPPRQAAPASARGSRPEEQPRRAPSRDSRRRSTGELSAAVAVVSAGEPRSFLWGGQLGTRVGLGEHAALMLDGRFERGSDGLALADVRRTSLSGLIGASARGQTGPIELSAGLGLRAGWLSLLASPRGPHEGGNLTAPWAGLALPMRAALASGGVRPFAAAELGIVTLPVRGTTDDDAVLVAHRGVWLAVSLGVALRL